jgi:hypothetical protein
MFIFAFELGMKEFLRNEGRICHELPELARMIGENSGNSWQIRPSFLKIPSFLIQ